MSLRWCCFFPLLLALQAGSPDLVRSQGFLEDDEPQSQAAARKPQPKTPTRKLERDYLESQEEADARPEDPPPARGPVRTQPSREATIAAIKGIYNTQGSCSSSRDSQGLYYVSTTQRSMDFKFDENGEHIAFSFHWMSQTVVDSRSSRVQDNWSYEFKLADIDIMNSKYEDNGNDEHRVTLFLYCKNSERCVVGTNGRRRDARIDFCGMENLRRVHRALKHLSGFYKPSPISPF